MNSVGSTTSAQANLSLRPAFCNMELESYQGNTDPQGLPFPLPESEEPEKGPKRTPL